MATTLVTGAAGFAGSHLLDLLTPTLTAGDSIVGWRRPGDEANDSAPADGRVIWESVDVLDRQAVRAAIDRLKPTAVYHCAGAAHVGRAWDKTASTFATNVRGTHYLLDALDRTNVETRVLIPSSALVYTPADRPLRETDPVVPGNPYGLSKLAQEMLACHSSPRVIVTVARAFNHTGPRQGPMFAAPGFARRIADIERGRWEPTVSVGNLDARRDLTDVRDTVRAYRLILEHGQQGDTFNVCSGVAITIRELLDKIVARARVAVTIQTDPARYRPSDTPLLVGDPTRIRERLGWTPTISLDQTIDDLLEYWRR
ncbi:MAG TPA: GDP-mannose 4,6-dehydratase [Vicinamibacterales bacterium]|jgi:GDP-4-dehydro-6-deoxy-D-mannose reductase